MYPSLQNNVCSQGKEHNFQKTGEQGYEVTHYDYDSIMHYPEWAFQRGDKPTIIPLDENAEIGVRGDLSACDIEKVKVHYGCKSKVIYKSRTSLKL